MNVEQVLDPVERARVCETVLADLPYWFGFEEVNAAYVRDVAELPTFRLGDDGLLELKLHNPRAAEVYVLGVRRARHRRGVGSALLAAGEEYFRTRGVEYLQVKTPGPSFADDGYAATRSFYEARGFVALEELDGLWEGDPRLLMVKRLCP